MFDPDFMKKLEYLALISRRALQGQLWSSRRSCQYGSGIEFADYRPYNVGDDLRYLDWNVVARFGDFLIKRFQEEEDLSITFFLDGSKSMNTGAPNKFDYARQLIAALAYIALSGLDRVGIVLFDRKIRRVFSPVRGRDRFLSILQFMESCEPSGESTDLTSVMTDFIHRRTRAGISVVVSDFYDRNRFVTGLDRLAFHREEPVLIQIHDVQERDPSFSGDLELTDREEGSTVRVTVDEKIRARYRKRFNEFLDEIRRYALEHSIGCVITDTSVPFDELILKMMRKGEIVH